MSGSKPAHAPLRWLASAAIYISAVLVSVTVLPASIVGWYYADPNSFGSAIGAALEYTHPAAVVASR